MSLVCYVALSVLYCFAIFSLQTRELVVLLKLSSLCHVAVSALCLFLKVPWVGLSLICVFAELSLGSSVPSQLLSIKGRDLRIQSDWVHAEDDLSLHSAHMLFKFCHDATILLHCQKSVNGI